MQRTSKSLYKKLYLSLITPNGLKDFNSHNKWLKEGFCYSRQDIISGCQMITKSHLSGRVQSTILRHMHRGYMDPHQMKYLKLIERDKCKLCNDEEVTYSHIFIYCSIGRFIRILLQERFYRATQQKLPINFHSINIFKLDNSTKEKSLQNLITQFIGAYKYVLHKHLHTGLANSEISNTKLPLDLTNKILDIVKSADDGKHKIFRFKKVPRYLSYEKENTPKLQDLLSNYFKKDMSDIIINTHDPNIPDTPKSINQWAFELLWKNY